MAGKKRVGIVLFQLGGPDSLQAVEPFLLNLFLDPDIIPMGPLGFLRRPLAKLISSRRSIPVAGKYAEIGRRSPIGLLTERQRVRLVEAVSPYIEPVAVTAMRYWHPMTAEAVDALRKAFSAIVRKEPIAQEWSDPINQILRITEGHDELVFEGTSWKMEFKAREGGLDWLLAAVARSAAEIIVEGARARLRTCANPACGLFFSDKSRTHRRRWCSMAICGNRHKVSSFARRHAS